MSTHTENCAASTAAAEAAIDAYEQAWPDHCEECNGTGVFRYDFNEETRSSVPAPIDGEHTDPCSCVENGNCARCGHSQISKEHGYGFDGPCSKCGWNYSDGGKPLQVECSCYEVGGEAFDLVSVVGREFTHALSELI